MAASRLCSKLRVVFFRPVGRSRGWLNMMAEKSGQALTLLLPGRSDQTATVVLEQFLPKVLGQSRTCDAHRTVPYSCAARPDLGSRTYGRTALGGRRPDLGDAQQIGRARLTKRHPSGDGDLIAYLPEPFF